MGSRDRRDPVGHKQRDGKNRPTPGAPQNQPATEQTLLTPPSRHVGFVLGARAEISSSPEFLGPVLDIHFVLPHAIFTARMPPIGWDVVKEVVAEALASIPPELVAEQKDAEQLQRAAAAGLHLPTGTDPAAEAAALQNLKEGPK